MVYFIMDIVIVMKSKAEWFATTPAKYYRFLVLLGRKGKARVGNGENDSQTMFFRKRVF